MRTLQPVKESEATGTVKSNYITLKESFNGDALPVFFTYIGAFPKYLDYITGQLTANLNDPKFQKIVDDTIAQILPLIKESLINSEETIEWKNRYRNSPSFYHFQKDLKKIFEMNMKLVFVFIALREAVKGWAVAAKKLPDSPFQPKTSTENQQTDTAEEFIYEQMAEALTVTRTYGAQSNIPVKYESSTLERNLLPEYLRLCRNDFDRNMKREQFVYLRLGIEKIILMTLPIFPNLILSPINQVIHLAKEDENFPGLLHLLLEHFPVYSVQRMMFSGLMMD